MPVRSLEDPKLPTLVEIKKVQDTDQPRLANWISIRFFPLKSKKSKLLQNLPTPKIPEEVQLPKILSKRKVTQKLLFLTPINLE